MREYFVRVITILMAVFFSLLSMPALAAGNGGFDENTVIPLPNADIKTIKGDYIGRSSNAGDSTSLRAAMEKLNHLNVLIYLITDNLVASTTPAQKGEDIVIDSLGNATVNSFTGLEKALADESVRCIRVGSDIAISRTLIINRSLRITADYKKSLLLLPGVKGRHLSLNGSGMDVLIENIAFFGGSVDEGGGIVAEGQKNRLQLKYCEFIGNVRKGADNEAKGGAISIESPKGDTCDYELMIDGCKFESNRTGQTGDGASGGAIYVNADSCNLAISDSIFTHNQSGGSGGAIAFYARNEHIVEIADSIFESNASINGGAIYLLSGSGSSPAKLEARLLDTKLSKNIAYNGSQDPQQYNGSGGGLYVGTASENSSVDLILESGSIQRNQSHNYGGGIYLNADAAGIISAVINGGLLLDGNRVDMLDGMGGGLAAMGQGSESITLSIEEAVISNNDAQSGGGMFIKGIPGGDTTANLADKCSIRNNKANYGGGVMLAEGAMLTASGGWSISSNIARFSGGGLYIKDNSHAKLNGGYISSNKAESGENASNRTGGGVYICESSKAELNGCNLDGNESRSGGGIFALGQVNMEGCHVKGNAAIYGGGVYIGAQGVLALKGDTFEGNNARALFDNYNMIGGEGGAVYTADSGYTNVTATGAIFADNNAESGGFTLADGDGRMDMDLLNDCVYTTPFESPYNNFDINNTLGDMATLYTIRVEYCYDGQDGQSLVEQVDRVFEGSELLPALIAGLGEDWLDMHHKDGYLEGYSSFDIDTNAIVGEDILIKVVYEGQGDQQPGTGESTIEKQPIGIEADYTDPDTSESAKTDTYAQTQQRSTEMAANIDKGGDHGANIPPSDEIAMAAPAPLPEGYTNKNWGMFNAVFAMMSILAGVSMLSCITTPKKRGRRLRSDCLPHKTAGVLLSVLSALAFALTQNTSLPAFPFDRWTPIFVAILLTQALLALAIYYKRIKRLAKAKARRRKPQVGQRRLTDAV